MPVWIVLLATAAYMAGLFWLAWKRDNEVAQNPDTKHNPVIYVLALAVYCTSWTYFGAVGTAASNGWDYLPIYIGPALVFLFAPGLIRRIGDIVQRESITSLSDFLAARYGKSRGLAFAAALAAVIGSLPYIALQLKSVGMSFAALTSETSSAVSEASSETVLLVTLSLAGFAILFGARRSDMTEQNPGLMRVLAFEALFKLAALLAVCALSISLLDSENVPVSDAFEATFTNSSLSGRFITITFLAIAAIICLPRQFHVAMIERRDAREVGYAKWLFPLYLLITSLVVIPITLAGLNTLPAASSADLFVLSLPLQQGDGLLALVVFLGGLSAATAMVVVSTIALSTMVTNDLIVPAAMRSGRFESISGASGARLLLIRRATIVILLLLAFGYYRAAGSSNALAQIGLLSFAAAAQFLPSLLGAVFWRGGKVSGAIAGLLAGMAVWMFTLFLPALFGHDRMLEWLPAFANPHALLGYSFGDSLTHGVVWSIGTNIALFVIVSLRSSERLRDRVQAAVFLGERGDVSVSSAAMAVPAGSITPDGLRALAARFLSEEAVEQAFKKVAEGKDIAIKGRGPADWLLVQRTERLLASALGSSSARVVLSSAIGGVDVSLPEVLSILDHGTQAQRFDRHMLQSMLENIEHGISVVDHEQRLVAWNSAYTDLFNYPDELVRVGQPIAKLISHNIKQGWISGDVSQQAEKRIAHMQSGALHSYERVNPDGRHLRISGNPMPGGGYVTTFIDITEDKIREQQLLNINETLESRVKDRTRELEQMTDDLDEARLEAESANASKTRFLAAASHDLLQPLNAARLLLGAIKGNKTLSQEQTDDLIAKTDKAVQSADELLKGLLDISRLDHGKMHADIQTIQLGPLLEDLADEAAPMAENAGLEIRIAPTSLSVQADPSFLKSILRNFLSNARRYTQKGAILLGARKRGDDVRIEVWDTGPGIAEESIKNLFVEFERLQDTDNVGVRGAGLGLAIAKRLADIMDAEIGVRSWPGSGSVFSLACPGAASSSPVTVRKETNTPYAGVRDFELRVLCVDDEAIILQGMKSLLESWGCDVVLAQSPDEIEAITKSGDLDVIIADYDLKHDQSGLDVIAEVNGHLRCAENAALISAKSGVVGRLEMPGAPHFIQKPVNPDAIRAFLSGCQDRLSHSDTDSPSSVTADL